jgi:transcription elongation factor Elf1
MTMAHVMKLYPFWDVAHEMDLKMRAGVDVYQQFNCEHCGTKQTMAEANKIFRSGLCEACGKETDLERNGCNYMAHIALSEKG